MILLSFDTEEFDLPKEHGIKISIDKSMGVSRYGTECILNILKHNQILTTFFITDIFADNVSDFVKKIVNEEHEVAVRFPVTFLETHRTLRHQQQPTPLAHPFL